MMTTDADTSKKYNFTGNSPIYLKHSDVSSTKGNILITICSAADRIANNQIIGATQSHGIWTIYIKSLIAKVNLLNHGLTIDNHQVTLYESNPYKRRDGEINEKIVFRGLPLELENSHIFNFLKRYEHIQTRSQIIYARERDEIMDSFSPFLNGERYIYVSAEGEGDNITPALPKDAIIGGHRVQIYHKSQKLWCLRCKNRDRPHNTNDIYQCEAYEPEKNVITIKSRDNVLSNFHECNISLWDQNFKSSEHAYQWKKCHELLKPELAEEVFKAPHPKQAKELVRNTFTDDEMEQWAAMKLNVMREILVAKADTNMLFRSTLIHSGSKRLVEATGPHESFWGVGLNPFLAGTTKHLYYPANSNHLGILLEEVRANLLKEIAQREQQRIDSFLESSPLDATATYNPVLQMNDTTESTLLTLESLAKSISNTFNTCTSSDILAQEKQHPPRQQSTTTIETTDSSTSHNPEQDAQRTSGEKQGQDAPHRTQGARRGNTSARGTPNKRPLPPPGPDSSPDITYSPKKQCTPIITHIQQQITVRSPQSDEFDNPKNAGTATETNSHVA